MAVNDADRSRDESTGERRKPGASRASAGQEPDEAPTPESEAAAMTISEPAAPGVWDVDPEEAARAERSDAPEEVAGAESAVPRVPDPDPAPQPDAGPPPSPEAAAGPVSSGAPAAGASHVAERASGTAPHESPTQTASSASAAGASRGASAGGSARAQPPGALRENLTSRTTWLRFVFMVLFVVLWGLSRVVLGAVVIMQFFWVLISGESNPRLAALGQTLATYSYEVILYLTFNTERQPFPFSDWPSGPPAS